MRSIVVVFQDDLNFIVEKNKQNNLAIDQEHIFQIRLEKGQNWVGFGKVRLAIPLGFGLLPFLTAKIKF